MSSSSSASSSDERTPSPPNDAHHNAGPQRTATTDSDSSSDTSSDEQTEPLPPSSETHNAANSDTSSSDTSSDGDTSADEATATPTRSSLQNRRAKHLRSDSSETTSSDASRGRKRVKHADPTANRFRESSMSAQETFTTATRSPSQATLNYERRVFLRFYEADGANNGSGIEEMIRTTPLLSFAAKQAVDGIASGSTSFGSSATSSEEDTASSESSAEDEISAVGDDRIRQSIEKLTLYTESPNPTLPHYGLLGFDVGNSDAPEPILLNTNAPNSAFICGSQGSGKSYTLSCMLEACLLPKQRNGVSKDAIAGVVFHYDTNAADTLAEVASLASMGIKVNVLVSRSAYGDLSKAYSQLEKADKNITVRPILFADKHLTVDRMNKLMAFTNTEGSVPLYMEVIQRILRQTKIDGLDFSFARFQQQLQAENFAPGQLAMLNMRMELLKSFCWSAVQQQIASLPTEKDRIRAQKAQGLDDQSDAFKIKAGELTIIDLSDPFIEPTTACVLFYVCLGIINANKPKGGMMVALDEAHKYLDKNTDAANIFTDQLLTTIREQRHNATRVIIATQEPTISERLLDLCSMSIVHRFTSPAWLDALKSHLGGASKMLADTDEQKEMFKRIVDLQVGESLVFSPSSFVRMDEEGKPRKLGTGVMKMKTRKREGIDAGRSVLVKR